MRWGYKTVYYELKKEGFMGSAFLDEAEVEYSLNEYGRNGWELVSVLEAEDGIVAFFKQPLQTSIQERAEQKDEGNEDEHLIIEDFAPPKGPVAISQRKTEESRPSKSKDKKQGKSLQNIRIE